MINLLNEQELKKYTYIKTYKAGDIVFNEKDLCTSIGIVEKGLISIVTITHTEKEEIITLVKENDIFGDALLFSSHPLYLGHGICKKDTTIRYISKESLMILFSIKPTFLESYLNQISNKMLLIKKENKLFKHKNIEDRIMHYLLDEKVKQKSNKIYINNVTMLANTLSIPRPSISRELTNMENKGLIKNLMASKSNRMYYLFGLCPYP